MLLKEMREELDDEENGPIIIFALAASQWEAGRLDDRIKRRALALIDAGVDFRWQGTKYQNDRRSVLLALRKRLLSPPPAAIELDDLAS